MELLIKLRKLTEQEEEEVFQEECRICESFLKFSKNLYLLEIPRSSLELQLPLLEGIAPQPLFDSYVICDDCARAINFVLNYAWRAVK